MKYLLLCLVVVSFLGCKELSIEKYEELPESQDGGRVLYQGSGDEVSVGGENESETLKYKRNF